MCFIVCCWPHLQAVVSARLPSVKICKGPIWKRFSRDWVWVKSKTSCQIVVSFTVCGWRQKLTTSLLSTVHCAVMPTGVRPYGVLRCKLWRWMVVKTIAVLYTGQFGLASVLFIGGRHWICGLYVLQIAWHYILCIQTFTKSLGWHVLSLNTHIGVGDLEPVGNALGAIIASPFHDKFVHFTVAFLRYCSLRSAYWCHVQ